MERKSLLEVRLGDIPCHTHEQVTVRYIHPAENLLHVISLGLASFFAQKIFQADDDRGPLFLYYICCPGLVHGCRPEVQSFVYELQTPVEIVQRDLDIFLVIFLDLSRFTQIFVELSFLL